MVRFNALRVVALLQRLLRPIASALFRNQRDRVLGTGKKVAQGLVVRVGDQPRVAAVGVLVAALARINLSVKRPLATVGNPVEFHAPR